MRRRELLKAVDRGMENEKKGGEERGFVGSGWLELRDEVKPLS